MDEGELLENHLEDARGSLKAAYESLNKQHTGSRRAESSADGLSEFGSGKGGKRPPSSKKGSDSSGILAGEIVTDSRLRPSQLLTKVRPALVLRACCWCCARVLPAAERAASRGALLRSRRASRRACARANALVFRKKNGTQPAAAGVQSEYEKAREEEVRATKSVRISILPMILYIAFFLAALIYAYTRVTRGMDGLILELRIYSFIVLIVELMGGVNMLFYGCWLFAKPDNTDVLNPVDEKVRCLPTSASAARSDPLHRRTCSTPSTRRCTSTRCLALHTLPACPGATGASAKRAGTGPQLPAPLFSPSRDPLRGGRATRRSCGATTTSAASLTRRLACAGQRDAAAARLQRPQPP